MGPCVFGPFVLNTSHGHGRRSGDRDLKRRVSEIEGSFGFLTEQVKGVHKDLLAFQARTEEKFEQVDKRFDRLETKIDGVDRKIDTKID